MAKTLDFNKAKKTYLTVTLSDANSTTIMIGTPTKAIMDDLMAIREVMDDIGDGSDNKLTEELYRLCAKVMSRNKGGVLVSQQLLEETLDFEDILIFFNAYMEFIGEITNVKN